MEIIKILKKIRNFVEFQIIYEKQVKIYETNMDLKNDINSFRINIGLDKFKEIILQDETALELGGSNNKSFSLIYPLHLLNFINDGRITLIGPEIDEIMESSVDFGIFLLIGFEHASEKDFNQLKHFNFISNGIEGFMIRTIPRRFWCRISNKVIDKFSFEFLGRSIIALYKEKFPKIVKSIEIIFISSNSDLIKQFEDITLEIRNFLNLKWKNKIEEWKKRIDCEYEWECNECPYFEVCENMRKIIKEREKIDE